MLVWNTRNRRVPLAVGTIVYIQDGVTPFRAPRHVVRRDPYIVLAWRNRVVGAAALENGQYVDRVRTGGHLAIVRSLRTGATHTVADWLLRISEEVAGGK